MALVRAEHQHPQSEGCKDTTADGPDSEASLAGDIKLGVAVEGLEAVVEGRYEDYGIGVG